MKNTRIFLFLITAISLAATAARAELKLPALVSDGMVLQRDLALPIWGWANPGEKVTVQIAGQMVQGEAGAQGRWEVTLDPIAGSSHTLRMVIRAGAETRVVANILIGEVWVCSGQSNMQWPVNSSFDADLVKLSADYPSIRLITVPQVGTQEIQDDFKGQWEAVTPETVGDFSAVGYFFGRQLHQALGVPVGLIDNAWGGSAAEAWVRRDVLEKDGRFKPYLDQWAETEKTFDYDAQMAAFKKKQEAWKAKADAAAKEGKPRPPGQPRPPRNVLAGQHRPGNLYAGVLHPVIGYGIRGAIWYQGESNAARATNYADLFPLMIQHWRDEWGQGDFPFYWVQLADFKAESAEPGDSDWAELRESQTTTQDKLANTGQAVIYDIGEGRDIHPRNKVDVGKRLARLALAQDYGVSIPHKNPRYESMEKKGNKIVLSFKDAGSTLYAFDENNPKGFAVAGADKQWHWANAKIIGKDKVEVWSDAVADPAAVRYAWSDNPVANLRSRENLPVTPFRTDDWPMITAPQPEPAPEKPAAN